MPDISYNVTNWFPSSPLSDTDRALVETEKNAGRFNPDAPDYAVFPLEVSGGGALTDPPVVAEGQKLRYPLNGTLTLEQLKAVMAPPQGFDLAPDKLDATLFEQFHPSGAGFGSKRAGPAAPRAARRACRSPCE
jgi:hypothetical protein